MSGPVSGWAVVLAPALVLVVLLTSPDRAAADPTRLRLSLDGWTWSSTVEQALFSGDRVLVPGDEDTVSFWVRNDSADAARLWLELVDVHGDLRLGSQLGLTAVVDDRPIALDGAESVLVLPPGGTDPAVVRLTARLPRELGNETQRRSLSFGLRVTLAGQPAPPTPPPSVAPGVVVLPGTGGPGITGPLLGAALVLAAAGVLALRHRIGRVRS